MKGVFFVQEPATASKPERTPFSLNVCQDANIQNNNEPVAPLRNETQ